MAAPTFEASFSPHTLPQAEQLDIRLFSDRVALDAMARRLGLEKPLPAHAQATVHHLSELRQKRPHQLSPGTLAKKQQPLGENPGHIHVYTSVLDEHVIGGRLADALFVHPAYNPGISEWFVAHDRRKLNTLGVGGGAFLGFLASPALLLTNEKVGGAVAIATLATAVGSVAAYVVQDVRDTLYGPRLPSLTGLDSPIGVQHRRR